MSYTPMMNNQISRGSYVPEYESNAYKIPPPPQNYGQYQLPAQQLYPQQNMNSIALFNVPSDGTNSLYVDGVPNDTSEREVSRKFIISQISFVLFLVFNAFGSLKRQLQLVGNFSSALLISRTFCSPPLR